MIDLSRGPRGEPLSSRLERTTIPEAITGCWLCWAAPHSGGYPRFSVQNETIYAHRAAWELHNKRTIPPGMMVRHRCDTPACVNPDHLLLGKHKENAMDREERGRGNQPREMGNGKCKLTDAQILAIRADTRDATTIAADYPVSVGYVLSVQSGRRRGTIAPPLFSLNELVAWNTKGGFRREGPVTEIVPAGTTPERAKYPRLQTAPLIQLKPRPRESYIVWANGRAYWPLPGRLKKTTGNPQFHR